MNRRNFFASLAVLPFLGNLVKASENKPKKAIMSTMYGQLGPSWDILSPQEIVDAGFQLVTRPSFIVDDQSYCIKTKQMTVWLKPEDVEAFLAGNRSPYKEEVIRQMKEAEMTHVYSVRFNESPIYDMQTGKSLGHLAQVRGRNINWFRGSVYEAACRNV